MRSIFVVIIVSTLAGQSLASNCLGCVPLGKPDLPIYEQTSGFNSQNESLIGKPILRCIEISRTGKKDRLQGQAL